MTPLEVVLSRLTNTKKTPAGWIAKCPAHKGGKQDLEIIELADKACHVHCTQGCVIEDVLGAVGLSTADLIPVPKVARSGKRDNVVPMVRPDPYAKEWQLIDAPPIPVRPLGSQWAADVEAVPVEWLWPEWIARGKLTLLGGDGGAGKTTVAMDFAATVTTGRKWPDGSACELPGDVYIWSAEDDRRDTLKPRLMAAKYNGDRLRFLGEPGIPFDPALHLPALVQDIEASGRPPSLIILDPLICAIDGNMNLANEVRRGLQPWVDFAERFNVALLGVHHLTKNSKANTPSERFTGSGAFNALARTSIICERKEDGSVCVMAKAKSNISSTQGGISYKLRRGLAQTLDYDLPAMVVEWGESLDGSAREILEIVRPVPEDDAEKSTRGREAEAFLIALLADGPVRADKAVEACAAAGFTKSVIYRAKEGLGVEKVKGFWRFGEQEK